MRIKDKKVDTVVSNREDTEICRSFKRGELEKNG